MEPISPIRRKISDERVGRAPFASVDRFGAQFARLLELRLRAATGGEALCRHGGATVSKFAALEPPGDHSSLAVAETPDGGFAGYVEVDPAIVARIIESAMNAPPGDKPAPVRALTRVDEALAQPLVHDCLDCFSAAAEADWKSPSLGGLSFQRYARSNAKFLELEAECDILELSVAVILREDAPETHLKVRLLVAALDRLKGVAPQIETVRQLAAPPDPRWSYAMRCAAAGSDIRLSTVLRRLKMSVGEAAELQPGDIVPLSFDGGMEVELVLPGRDGGYVCAGQLGAADDRRAVMITDPPEEAFRAMVSRLLGHAD